MWGGADLDGPCLGVYLTSQPGGGPGKRKLTGRRDGDMGKGVEAEDGGKQRRTERGRGHGGGGVRG